MTMNINSLTIKAQEALQAAASKARESGQQSIDPLHLLGVLIAEDDSLSTFLLGRVGVNVRKLRGDVAAAIASLAKVSGGNSDQYFSSETSRVIQRAVDFTKKFNDKYASVEHLLLGLLSEDSSVAANILRMHDVTYTATRRLAQELAGDGSGVGAEMTPGLRRIIKSAAETAARHGNACVGTEDLLLSILYDKECVAVKLILSQNASISEIQNDILSFYGDFGAKKDEKP